MTETEWLSATDPTPMLEWLRHSGKASDCKLRLFAAACCRRIWRLFPEEPRTREAVIVSERYADGLATREELKAARKRARHCEVATTRLNAHEAAAETASAAAYEVRLLAIEFRGRDPFLAGYSTKTPTANRLAAEEAHGQSSILRDIFGPLPFRLLNVEPSLLTWQHGTVVKLAHGIYEKRAFDRMPVLADALEEAGCENQDILLHCRSQDDHVLACWVIDLLLGKR